MSASTTLKAPTRKAGDLWKRIRRHRSLYLLGSISLVYFVSFKYVPIWNSQIAFRDFQALEGVVKSPWVGLQNFRDFVNSYYFWELIRNTIFYSIGNMVFYNSPLELSARYPYFKTANGRKMGPMLYLKTFQGYPWVSVNGAGTIAPSPNNADLKRYIDQGVQEFVLRKNPLTKDGYAAFIAQMDKLGAAAWEKAAKAQMDEAGYLK